MASQPNSYPFPPQHYYFEEDPKNPIDNDSDSENELAAKTGELIDENENNDSKKVGYSPNASQNTFLKSDYLAKKTDSIEKEKNVENESEIEVETDEETTQKRLRIDPNYVWLLKDLALSNQKRVIDVTNMLEEEKVNTSNDENNQVENGNNEPLNLSINNLNASIDASKQESEVNNSIDSSRLGKEDEEEFRDMKESRSENKDNRVDQDEEHDDHEDHNYINKLYEKLVKPSVNKNFTFNNRVSSDFEKTNNNDSFFEEDQEENDFGNRTGEFSKNNTDYKEWFEQNRTAENHPVDQQSEDDHMKNKANKFSKSFEISIAGMDNLIDRVDNGIKLKRKPVLNDQQDHTGNNKKAGDPQAKVVESLKQEWSTIMQKLEQDYRDKLDEQQKLNDMRLKSFQEEIKNSLIEQQYKFLQQQLDQQQKRQEKHPVSESHNDQREEKSAPSDLSSFSFTSSNLVNNQISATSTVPNSQASIVGASSFNTDNAKYIANMKAELKAKHSRHIQDLKDYYEKELDDMRKELNLIKIESEKKTNLEEEKSHLLSNHEKMLRDYEEEKRKHDKLSKDYNDLRTSYDVMMEKMVSCFFFNIDLRFVPNSRKNTQLKFFFSSK